MKRMERANVAALPLDVIRSNACLAAGVTDEAVQQWKEVFARHGPVTSMVVRPAPDGGYVVVAGEAELEALRALEIHRTETVVAPVTEPDEAHRLSLQLLCLRHASHHLEEALIMKEILRDPGVSQSDLARLCGRSLSWVSKRMRLVDSLKPSVVTLVARRLLAPASAQEIAKLPPKEQYRFANRVISDRMPKSAVERLVSLYHAKGTSDELRSRILSAPKDVWATLQQNVAAIERSPSPQEGDDSRPERACRLLERLFERIRALWPADRPPHARESPHIARMRALTEDFLAHVTALETASHFPRGKENNP